MELAKCEEDVEQIEVAMHNYKKALALDDTGQYEGRFNWISHFFCAFVKILAYFLRFQACIEIAWKWQ